MIVCLIVPPIREIKLCWYKSRRFDNKDEDMNCENLDGDMGIYGGVNF